MAPNSLAQLCTTMVLTPQLTGRTPDERRDTRRGHHVARSCCSTRYLRSRQKMSTPYSRHLAELPFRRNQRHERRITAQRA